VRGGHDKKLFPLELILHGFGGWPPFGQIAVRFGLPLEPEHRLPATTEFKEIMLDQTSSIDLV
jgi:hypothetical protein